MVRRARGKCKVVRTQHDFVYRPNQDASSEAWTESIVCALGVQGFSQRHGSRRLSKEAVLRQHDIWYKRTSHIALNKYYIAYSICWSTAQILIVTFFAPEGDQRHAESYLSRREAGWAALVTFYPRAFAPAARSHPQTLKKMAPSRPTFSHYGRVARAPLVVASTVTTRCIQCPNII
jgi:hypothetical protein